MDRTDSHDKITSIISELDDLSTPYMFDVTDYKALTHEGMKRSIDINEKLFYQR